MWLSVKEVSELIGIADRNVRKHIYDGKYLTREIQNAIGGGHDGKSYQIHFTSLPTEARKKYLEKLQDIKNGGIETGQNTQGNKSENFPSLFSYINKYGVEEVDKALQIEAAIQDIKSANDRLEVGRRVKKWAKLFDVTDNAIRNWRKEYAEHGLVGLFRKEHPGKGIRISTCEGAADQLKIIFPSDQQIFALF